MIPKYCFSKNHNLSQNTIWYVYLKNMKIIQNIQGRINMI